MKYTLLGDCCDILDSQRVPVKSSDRKNGEYPYYGANGLQGYIDDFIFDDELVLLAEDGGNFGSKEKPIAYRVSGKCWVNNHAHVLKPKNSVNVDYLCYALMFYPVENLVNGATRKKLNQAEMRKMKIPLRTMEEQMKIVNNLDLLTKIIEIQEEKITTLDTLIKSRFVEMFGDPVKNTKQWGMASLDKICSSIVDCPHSTPNYLQENTGYMCIRTSIVKKNRIQWENIEYISEEEYKNRIQRKKPCKGDVIYTREGAILGIAAIIDKDYNVALGQRSMLLTPNKQRCNSIFLCIAMNSDVFLQTALKGQIGSASPHINVKDIKNFRIIVPPIELQNQFANFVQQVDQAKQSVNASIETLQTLKASLMQKYFH